ncbi:MAG: M81 family metallopeptidase [Elsteraceae bacterium]
MARILVGQLWHESHAFNPKPTPAQAFTLYRGAAVLTAQGGAGSTLGGIIRRLRALGHTPVPTIAAQAPPSGRVDHGFYVQLKAAILERARVADFSAVAFELHGAMMTTELADAEGDLLSGLRALVGADMPIGVGLDLHGHLTPAMLSAADFCVACKQNPHADVVEAGERVAHCVSDMLAGRLKPVTAMVKAPLVLAGKAETVDEPLAGIFADARWAEITENAVRDVSIFTAYPFVDDEGLGQAVLAMTDGAPDLAVSIAEEIAADIWRLRDEFRDDFPDIAQALSQIAENPEKRPYALSDMGDRVLSGAPGDSNAILAEALRRGDLKGAIPITDPEAAAKAIAAGVGAELTLDVGGGMTPGFSPITVEGRVVAVSKGEFIMKGPYQAGQKTMMGPTAVFAVGGLSLLLTSLPAFSQDPNAFLSQGVDIASQDFVVVKSGNHFKLCFEGVATPLVARSPGIGSYQKGFFPYQKARFHPEHPIHEPDLTARLYGRRS